MTIWASAPAYGLGHSKDELDRLTQQGSFYVQFTETVFRNAGLRAGMRVLDVGCGAGDVSLVAARLVGPDGYVRGVDRAHEAIQAARSTAAAAGCFNVDFVQGDLDEFDGGEFDAVVGRFILLHVPDRERALSNLKRILNPNGIMAFVEMDLSTAGVFPPLPLFDEALRWICEAYLKDGVEVDMGSRLFGVMKAAQMNPRLMGFVRTAAGEDTDEACDYLTETVRSLLPRIEQLGVADPKDVHIETLAERLKARTRSDNSCIFYPRMIGAWGALQDAG